MSVALNATVGLDTLYKLDQVKSNLQTIASPLPHTIILKKIINFPELLHKFQN